MRPLRALRRRVLTPSIEETRISRRGFHQKSPGATALLETVGARFLDGFAAAVGTASARDAEPELEAVPTRFRGFAYEGAGMGFAVLDALTPGGGRRTEESLAGRGRDHEYMILVGVGWAMARLPRVRRPRADRFDPLLRWLVLDGYGFHQAYFHTPEQVVGARPALDLAWPSRAGAGYAARAADQGVGRALWFVAGTDAARAADLVDAFPRHRHEDLWSGIGLAATYAGGSDEAELEVLVRRCGPHRGALAQGSAFAAEARLCANLDVPHVATATAVLAGSTPAEAAELCRATRPRTASVPRGADPAYETWRRRIAQGLTTSGGVRR